MIAGLANEKTVHVEAGEDGSIAVTRTIPKNFNKPRESRSKATKKNKNFRRTASRLGREVQTTRPDLKVTFPELCRYIPRRSALWDSDLDADRSFKEFFGHGWSFYRKSHSEYKLMGSCCPCRTQHWHGLAL